MLCTSRADSSQARAEPARVLRARGCLEPEPARVSWHPALGGSNRGRRADSSPLATRAPWRLEPLGGFLAVSWRLEPRVQGCHAPSRLEPRAGLGSSRLVNNTNLNTDLSDLGRRTPLSYAADSGSEGVVKLLLARGDVISDLSGWGRRTPLSYAAKYGREDVVKLLLARKDVNSDLPDWGRRTPL